VPLSTRRLIRWAAVVAAMVVGLLMCWYDTAHAHGSVIVTLHSDGRGSVWADLKWNDGHPVSENIAAAITARSRDGKRVGPVAMAGYPGEPTIRYEGTLAAGQWTVTVEAAEPATGICSADFAVGAGAQPNTVTCGGGRTIAAEPTQAAGSGGSSSGRTLMFAAIVAGVVVVAGLALLMVRDRS
jgi:hypothetical protein